MMDCVLSGSLLVVFSLFCYAMCVFFEQINSLSFADVYVSQGSVATYTRFAGF